MASSSQEGAQWIAKCWLVSSLLIGALLAGAVDFLIPGSTMRYLADFTGPWVLLGLVGSLTIALRKETPAAPCRPFPRRRFLKLDHRRRSLARLSGLQQPIRAQQSLALREGDRRAVSLQVDMQTVTPLSDRGSTLASPNMDISVVLPIYNERENLLPLLDEIEGVLAPTGKQYEIIAVDDGSHDGSAELLREAARSEALPARRSSSGATPVSRPRSTPAFALPPATWSSRWTRISRTIRADIPRLHRQARRGVRRGHRLAQGAQGRHVILRKHPVAHRQLHHPQADRHRKSTISAAR